MVLLRVAYTAPRPGIEGPHGPRRAGPARRDRTPRPPGRARMHAGIIMISESEGLRAPPTQAARTGLGQLEP